MLIAVLLRKGGGFFVKHSDPKMLKRLSLVSE